MSSEDRLRDHRSELQTQAGKSAYEAVREVVWYGVRDRFPAALDLVAYVGDRLIELERAALAPDDTTGEGTCSYCGGQGWYVGADPLPSGEPGEPYQVQCSECGGTGKVARTEAAPALDVERIREDEATWGLRCTGCGTVHSGGSGHRPGDAGDRPCCPDCEHVSYFISAIDTPRAAPALDVERLVGALHADPDVCGGFGHPSWRPTDGYRCERIATRLSAIDTPRGAG
jgi:hypothetical protein